MSIWTDNKFPTRDYSCVQWLGKRKTLKKPFCWTPAKPFSFGGRQFIALYPCVAFETKNFGWVLQKLWYGMTIARE